MKFLITNAEVVTKDDENPSKWDNVMSLLATILQKEEVIMTQVNDLAAVLTQVNDQLAKAKVEITTKIDGLAAALTNVALPTEAQIALDSLTAMSQTLDDIVPDVPVVVEPPADVPPAEPTA